MASVNKITVTVVGDGAIGKTCLLMAFRNRDDMKIAFDNYIPTVFTSYEMVIPANGKNHNVVFNDTAGQEEYDMLRPLGYTTTDTFVVCYSINSKASYENIPIKWIPEVRHFRPNARIILVATQTDLRNVSAKSKPLLTTQNCQQLASKIKADDFIECSALTGFKVNEVFAKAVSAALIPRRRRKCTLL